MSDGGHATKARAPTEWLVPLPDAISTPGAMAIAVPPCCASSPPRAGRARRIYLRGRGAAEIVDRATLSEPGKPIGAQRRAGAVDAVGSHTLANVLADTRYRGVVAACGLAQGMNLPASVAPFVLRNVTRGDRLGQRPA